jgi:uncharacterized membrane protein YgcG
MKRFLRIGLSFILVLMSVQIILPQMSFSAALGVPTNVVVRTSTDAPYLNASLTVTWDEVESATAYAVIATRAGTSTVATAAVSGKKNTQAVISGLIGGVTYVVQVRTIENQNFSDWSASSLTATPTTLPKSVDKPTAIPDVGTATVNWTALVGDENGGSAITSYVVTETNSGKSISASSSASTIEFTDLDQGVGAIFTVTALTAISTTGSVSTASDEVTITSADDEGASPTPTATASASSTPTPTPTSSSTSGSGGGAGGGFGGGGGGFGGGEDTATASASPSPSTSASGSPSPSPSASKSPSPSPSPSAVISSNSASPLAKPSVVCTTAKPVTKGGKGVVTCITTYPKGSTAAKPSLKCVTAPPTKKGAKSVVTCSTIAPSKKASAAPSKSATTKASAKATTKASAAPSKKSTSKASTKPAAKKITITCVKGKTTQKVTAIKPVCPKGYTKK